MGEKGSQEGKESGVEPGHCGSAKEYAVKRLEAADGPLSPSDLADEYDCGNEHMGDSLRALVEEGSARRVSRGKYASAGDSSTTETGDATEEQGDAAAEPVSPDGGSSGEVSGADRDGELAPNADEVAAQWGVEGAGDGPGPDHVDVGDGLREQLAEDVDADGGQEEGEPEGEDGEPVDVEVVEEESGGIPLPVSTPVLVGAVVLLALAYLVWVNGDGDGELEVEDVTGGEERDQVTMLEG